MLPQGLTPRSLGTGLLVVAVATLPARAQTVEERANKFVESTRLEWGAPGVSVAVARESQIVFARGVGWAKLADSVPVDPETTYRIASTSKAITATAVLQLVERGLVDLEDDIRRYVPSFPPKRWPITVRQVLTHTSGVRHYAPGETSRKTEHYPSVTEAISLFADDSLLFEPGTSYGYSTYAYTLLQGVVESASGLPFREYLRRNVWQPAGMTHSDLELKDDTYPHRATGHNRPGGIVRAVPFDDVSFKYAGGGMLSTATDLVRFCSALFDGRLLGPALLEESISPQIPQLNDQTGYAWGVRRDSLGRRVIWHPGRSYGFESQLLCYPDQHLAVAVVTNQDWTNPWREVGGLADFLAHVFLDPDVPAEAVATLPVATAVLRALEDDGPERAKAVYRAFLANPYYRYGDPAIDVDALGRRLLSEGRLDIGAAVLRLNSEVYPDSWRAWAGAGDALLARGALDEAANAYRRLLALQSEAPEARRRLAWLERRGTTVAFAPRGTWRLEASIGESGRDRAVELVLELQHEQGRTSGRLTSPIFGTAEANTVVAADSMLWIVSSTSEGLLELELTVVDGAATGRWRLDSQSGKVSGRRR